MIFSNLVRNIDPITSVEAAQVVEPKLSNLQRQVFEWIRDHGPVIDSQLVTLAYSMGYSESTLRKRRTELSQMGMLELCGERKNERGRSELSWQVVPRYL